MNFQIQNSTTNTKFVYLRLVRIHKKYKHFPKIFITTCSISVHQIVVLHQICYCLPGIIVPVLCSIRIHYFSNPDISRIFILPETAVQSARYFQNHHFTRNCYFSPPDISRIIILPETATSVRQILLYYCIITSISKIINVLLLFSYKCSHPPS